MKFFKRKKPKYAKITSVKQIKAHLREFILDSQIPDGDAISVELGCSPVSEEVLEREHEESDARVEKIGFLVPLLYGYAALFSEAFVSVSPSAHDHENPEMEKFYDHIAEITKHALKEPMAHLLVGSISQMVDLGLLEIPKGKR